METHIALGRHLRVVGISVATILCLAAYAAADPITVAWDANSEPVSGYIVYVGTQAGSYTQQFNVGATTSYTYPSAVAGQRYCFAVSAYAASAESPLSGAVCGYSDAPPTLDNPGNQSSPVGSPISLLLVGRDPYGQALTYSATGLPAGLSLASTTGWITGTGTTTGSYAVTARASDGRLSASQSFTWTMTAPAPLPPTISITTPTAAATYATTTSSLALRGSASGSSGISQVTWMNDRGGSGTASGTTSWFTPSIPLQSGANVLTVIARDGSGNSAADVLTVTYSAPAPTPTPLVTLSAQTFILKGMKTVVLRWQNCTWTTVDVFRDGLRLAITENDGTFSDAMRKNRSVTYRICDTRNNASCSNSVAVYF